MSKHHQIKCPYCGESSWTQGDRSNRLARCNQCSNDFLLPMPTAANVFPGDHYDAQDEGTLDLQLPPGEEHALTDDDVIAFIDDSAQPAAVCWTCPDCGIGLAVYEVICVSCGHDKRTGQRMRTEMEKVAAAEMLRRASAAAGARTAAGFPFRGVLFGWTLLSAVLGSSTFLTAVLIVWGQGLEKGTQTTPPMGTFALVVMAIDAVLFVLLGSWTYHKLKSVGGEAVVRDSRSVGWGVLLAGVLFGAAATALLFGVQAGGGDVDRVPGIGQSLIQTDSERVAAVVVGLLTLTLSLYLLVRAFSRFNDVPAAATAPRCSIRASASAAKVRTGISGGQIVVLVISVLMLIGFWLTAPPEQVRWTGLNYAPTREWRIVAARHGTAVIATVVAAVTLLVAASRSTAYQPSCRRGVTTGWGLAAIALGLLASVDT